MSPAFINSAALPFRNAKTHTVSQRRPVSMVSQTPPESRVARHYPLKGRFQAPTLNLHSVPDCELMSKIGLVMEEVPLDLEYAASVMESLRADYVKETGDFPELFVKDASDTETSHPMERYFPKIRRNEAPIIEITGNASEPGSVTISVGSVIAEAAPDATDEAADIASRSGEFWKQHAAPNAREVILRNYGTVDRNKAPVIVVNEGELGVSLAMESIEGSPDMGVYADRHMLAPTIRMKRPMGDWDSTGFIEVGCEEVQLPILKTL